MRAVLLEDDAMQAEMIVEQLTQSLSATVEVIETEEEFRAYLVASGENPPDVFLLDVMVPWTRPRPDMQLPPEDVRQGGAFRAGIRCRQLLHREPRFADTAAILYTILERTDLSSEIEQLELQGIEVLHIQKTSSLEELVEALRKRVPK